MAIGQRWKRLPEHIDRLSALPDDVIEAILIRLPINEAVQTSILSSRWRYQWSNISQLVFDKQHFPLRPGQNSTSFDDKLVKIIDQVLLLHRGPVLSFELSIDLRTCVGIDRWIPFLSRNGIKKLALLKWEGLCYKLHPSVFSCNEMTSLKLFRCTIDLPVSFKGFTKLTVLDLQSVFISSDALEALISMCPLLRELALRDIFGCTGLKIRAPQLIALTVDALFEGLSLESIPLVAAASISLQRSGHDHDQSVAEFNLIEVFGLPGIEKLELLAYTLLISTSGDVPMELPIAFHLKYLTVQLDLEDMQEVSAFMCCVRSSPVLEKVILKACSDEEEAQIPILDFWEAQDHDCQFSSLKVVEVTEFSGTKSEMRFTEFLLANAPFLETLQIEFTKDVGDLLKIMREFVQFQRTPSKARIILPNLTCVTDNDRFHL